MAKVIVERPRKKGWAFDKPKGYSRRLLRYGPDGPPGKEGIKACWGNRTKFLNEHLGPLRRYLDSQLGRPWDKVFSEICAHIDRNSAVQDHVRDHIAQYVTVHVSLINGVPHSCAGDPSHGSPLHEMRWRPWYVCPRTGLLRRVERPKQRHKAHTSKPLPFIRVSDTAQCRLVNDAWFLIKLKPLPRPEWKPLCHDVDVFLARPVTMISPDEARKNYGTEAYATEIRRLGRKEFSQYPIPPERWK